MKPKNFPGRKYRRQLRANLKVWEMLGIPITWEMRSIAVRPYLGENDQRRVGAKGRDEHGQIRDMFYSQTVNFITHNDIIDATMYAHTAVDMDMDFETFRQIYPQTSVFWKDPNVTP